MSIRALRKYISFNKMTGAIIYRWSMPTIARRRLLPTFCSAAGTMSKSHERAAAGWMALPIGVLGA